MVRHLEGDNPGYLRWVGQGIPREVGRIGDSMVRGHPGQAEWRGGIPGGRGGEEREVCYDDIGDW